MILDGYNFCGEIADGGEVLRFVYRPMLSTERRQYIAHLRGINGWNPDRSKLQEVNWIRQHIVSMENGIESLAGIRFDRPRLFKMLTYVVAGQVGPDNNPEWSRTWESEDVQNLRDGIYLEVAYPKLARRSCSECQKYWFNEDGSPVLVNEKKVLRTTEPTDCQTSIGCPIGDPENQKRLSLRNAEAWNHFRLCEAVGQFPDDPIVRRNALVIRAARNRAVRHGRGGLPAGFNGQRSGGLMAGTRDAGRGSVPAGGTGIFAPFGLQHL